MRARRAGAAAGIGDLSGRPAITRAAHLRDAGKSLLARASHGFNASEALTAGGYTLLSLYTAGFVAYIAAAY